MNQRSNLRQVCGIAFAFALLLHLPQGWATEGGIQPLPPDGVYQGLQLVDWVAAYQQWFVSIPQNAHPDTRFDTTGRRSGVGQRGPVWFLPSFAPGSSGARTFIVPEEQAILVSTMWGVSVHLPGSRTEAQLLEDVVPWDDEITDVEVSLDGAAVADIMHSYRVTTSVFTVLLPPGNVFGETVSVDQDGRRDAAADGYWLMYPALPSGTHVLTVRVAGYDLDTKKTYDSRWTFNLIVYKAGEPHP